MKKAIGYSILGVGVLGAVLFVVLYLGGYPILNVNGTRIWADEYFKRMNGFEHYREITKEELDEKIVQRGVIFSLIVDLLIQDELKRRNIPSDSVNQRIEETLGRRNQEEFEKAVQQLYGWDIDVFRTLTLLPQARQDILVTLLEREEKDFNTWVQEVLQTATVHIYLLPYTWQAGELIDK